MNFGVGNQTGPIRWAGAILLICNFLLPLTDCFGSDLASAFRRINAELGSYDPKLNLIKVKELLAEREGKQVDWSRPNLVEALRLIVDLEGLSEKRNCTSKAVRLIKRAHLNSMYQSDNKIGLLVFKLVKDHAVTCRNRFATEATDNLDFLVPEQSRARVRHFQKHFYSQLMASIHHSHFPLLEVNEKDKLGRYLTNRKLHGSKMGITGFYALLYAVDKFKDPEKEEFVLIDSQSVNKSLVERTLSRQLGQPCSAYLYMQHFLQPALFELKYYFRDNDWFQPERNYQFYEMLKDFHTCALLFNGEYEKLLKDIIKYIRDQGTFDHLTW